jgi:glutaredoxin
MKKLLIFVIIGTLILGGFGAGAINIVNESKNINTNEDTSGRATHTVLGEYGTATWCPYCVYAHGALKELYNAGQLDFNYVTLVTDMNSKANARAIGDYNAYGWPTLWWDGGYKVDVGASSVSQAKAAYTASINACGSRAVEDLDAELTVNWLGGTNMKIDCTVTNNEDSTYGGHIRVYIIEKTSSMGWEDLGGQLYTHPFLDWAFNEAISITSGESWTNSMTWDGTSHGYSSITSTNIMIVAAVFNDEMHQGYSYPPSGNPFNAYYVDEVVTAEPILNNAPSKTTISGPTSGETGIEYQYTFTATDSDGDNVYFWIDWGDGTSNGWLGPYNSEEPVNVAHIFYEEGIYEITAKAKDSKDLEGAWSDPYEVAMGFAPSGPTIKGKTGGKTGTAYTYTFNAIDPKGDQVRYIINWGDGKTDTSSFYSSGTDFTLKHIWTEAGTYIIKAKAEDNHGLIGPEGTLTVTITKNKEINTPFLQFQQQYQNVFLILKYLLGL